MAELPKFHVTLDAPVVEADSEDGTPPNCRSLQIAKMPDIFLKKRKNKKAVPKNGLR
jgi:hypothetical protein